MTEIESALEATENRIQITDFVVQTICGKTLRNDIK